MENVTGAAQSFVKTVSPVNLRILSAREKQLNAVLGPFRNGELLIDNAVHLTRKYIKQSRAFLLLIKTELDPATFIKLNRDYRFIAKQLAKMREYYVLLQTFTKFKKHIINLNKKHWLELELKLSSQYKNLLKDDFITVNAFGYISEKLEELDSLVDFSQIGVSAEFLQRRIHKTYKKCRKVYKNLSLSSTSVQFHQLRKWSKILQYQDDFLKTSLNDSTSRFPKKKQDELNELIGREHDIHDFIQYLQIHFRTVHKKTIPFLNKKVLILRKKILAISGKYYE